MSLVINYRASTILYNFILSNDTKKGTWILPTNICHYVAATILKAGASIEIIDVSEDDFCLDNDIVISKLEANSVKYSGVIYVRGFGIENNANSIFNAIKNINKDILIVDDKCLSIPSIKGEVSSLVDMELYSTGYSKFIDLGYGGYAKLNKNINYEKAPLLYNEEDEQEFTKYFRGIIFDNNKPQEKLQDTLVNSNWLKSEEINTVEYLAKIEEKLKETKDNKEKINSVYESCLLEKSKISQSLNNWRYNIVTENRIEILDALQKEDLFASKHYHPLSKVFKSEESPVWDKYSGKILNLFNDFRYSVLKAQKTSEIINKIEER